MWYHSCSVSFIDVPFSNASLNIYTVGCPHKCSGCHAQDLQDINHPERQTLDETVLKYQIEKSKGLIQSVCWLGGDPLYQFSDCIRLSCFIKDNYSDLTNVVFTGYTLEELNKDIEKQRKLLFGGIDFLIDGEWKGKVISDPESNQRIFHFDKSKLKFIQLTYEQYKNYGK